MNIRTKISNRALAAVLLSFPVMWMGVSCQNGVKSDDSQWAYFGDSITVEGATDVSELPELMKGKPWRSSNCQAPYKSAARRRAVG